MRVFRLMLPIAGAFCLALLCAGYLNRLHPALDSLSHFRLHLAAAGLLTGLALFAMRDRGAGLTVFTVSVIALATTVWPVIGTGKAEASDEPGATYRMLHANLRFDNQTPEEFIRLVGETKPDIMTLAEVSWTWEPRLKTISAMYPYQKYCPALNKYGGVAVFSRRPFVADGLGLCDRESALAVQTVDIGGQAITVVAMHLEWPWPKLQPEQIEWLKPEFEKIRNAGNPVLIGGDMNAVPWSATLERMAFETGTKVLPQVWGTWFFNGLPRGLAPWIGLPIDNILTSDGMTIRSIATQRSTGSDHRAVLIEFALPTKGGSEDSGMESTAIGTHPARYRAG